MVRRRSVAADGDSTTGQQRRGRRSIAGSSSEMTVPDDDCVYDSDVMKCELTSASPVMLKRRQKPNTLYANDFVFQSIRKAKVPKLESEFGSEQPSVKTAESDRESDKADHAVGSTKKKKSKFANAQASSDGHSCSAKKRTRKPKLCSDVFSGDVENVKSGSLPSSLNLSPRGAPSTLGEKDNIGGSVKSHLANTSLPAELLSTGLNSSTDRTEVPLTAPRKRGRPRKNPNDTFTKKPCDELLNIDSNSSNSVRTEVPMGVPRKPAEVDFACSHCSETFASVHNIRSHMARRHHLIVS